MQDGGQVTVSWYEYHAKAKAKHPLMFSYCIIWIVILRVMQKYYYYNYHVNSCVHIVFLR